MLNRKETILLNLKKLDFLSRNQINKMHYLKSVRNTNRVLKEMQPYLSSFREGYDTVYYLNREGREMIGSEKVRKKTPQVRHFLMRNDFYIFVGQPAEWKQEIKITDGTTTVITDALYMKQGKYHFLEVDNEQMMVENRKKIDKYKAMQAAGVFQKQFGYFPKVIYLTTSEYRKKKLSGMLEGIPFEVYTHGDIK